jgi:hypothetical protein
VLDGVTEIDEGHGWKARTVRAESKPETRGVAGSPFAVDC